MATILYNDERDVSRICFKFKLNLKTNIYFKVKVLSIILNYKINRSPCCTRIFE